MAKKNVFQIIEELQGGLAELKEALEPLASLAASTTGSSTPSQPRKRTRKKSTKKAAAKKTAVKKAAAKETAAEKTAGLRKKPKLSPKQIQQRRRQGRYMGLVRNMSKTRQAQIKKVRKDKGLEAAIKLAESFRK